MVAILSQLRCSKLTGLSLRRLRTFVVSALVIHDKKVLFLQIFSIHFKQRTITGKKFNEIKTLSAPR